MYTDDIHTVKITTNTLLERIVVALIQSPMVLIQKVGANSWCLPSFKPVFPWGHRVCRYFWTATHTAGVHRLLAAHKTPTVNICTSNKQQIHHNSMPTWHRLGQDLWMGGSTWAVFWQLSSCWCWYQSITLIWVPVGHIGPKLYCVSKNNARAFRFAGLIPEKPVLSNHNVWPVGWQLSGET